MVAPDSEVADSVTGIPQIKKNTAEKKEFGVEVRLVA